MEVIIGLVMFMNTNLKAYSTVKRTGWRATTRESISGTTSSCIARLNLKGPKRLPRR